MPNRFAARCRHVVPLALALFVLGAVPASAATTRFASPGGVATPSTCTDAASPCSLPVALGSSQAGDTVSLGAGAYDLQAIALPQVPLHWVATDKGTRPLLSSAGAAATVFLTSGSSGSSFEGLEIDNTSTGGVALGLNDGVDATVGSSVLKGPHCVVQGDGDQVPGELTIEDSTLSSPVGRTCATVGRSSILRRSSVSQTAGIATQTPPAAVVTDGLVEDTQISGGLQLVGAAAVARRVIASGSTGIEGEGLVVDSVARAVGSLGAAIAVDTPHGGALRVVNATAVASAAPALEARQVLAPAGTTVNPNSLVVTDSIARGAPDLRASTPPILCPIGMSCEAGEIVIDHSNFASREPAAGSVGDTIEVLPGNQSGDPLFTAAAAGDFHLRAGSPAIDAGDDPQARSLPTDADGHPRVQGAAIDLGAFEFSPPPSGGTGPSGSGPPAPGGGPTTTAPPTDRTAPRLGRLRLSRTRFRAAAGTTLTATTNETGQLRIAVQRGLPGRRVHGRCVSTKHSGPRCTRFVATGSPLTRRVAKPGAVKVNFSGRIARRLAPGAYRFVVNAIDAAGNRSAPRTISFTILRATR